MRLTDGETAVERTSDRELVVTRTVRGAARHVFEAWARPDLFKRWWAPASFGVTIISYEADVRTGGTYRLEMGHPTSDQTMTFFGRYLDVVPDARIVWTNDEGDQDGPVTTVTFEESDGETLVTVRDLYPSKQSLDEAIASGSTSGWGEQLRQLDAILADLDAGAGGA
ncbi:SRPBCC domain-containing protein [Sphingomonas asaccharolytica]|uniref:SRPBCC domain-containing protein n=1 Tax=Sphingomonas asaccharolytica TaxID=40681 RepID=UPI0008353B9E|nr:SRPBCC domain-containing protein [Sphingomonas asaccharolytica]